MIDAVDQSSIFVENENIDMNEKNKQISLLNQKIEQTMEEYNNKTSSQRQLKNSMDIITILITVRKNKNSIPVFHTLMISLAYQRSN